MIDKKYEITDLETVANELYADKKHYQLFWEKAEVSLFPFLKKREKQIMIQYLLTLFVRQYKFAQ